MVPDVEVWSPVGAAKVVPNGLEQFKMVLRFHMLPVGAK